MKKGVLAEGGCAGLAHSAMRCNGDRCGYLEPGGGAARCEVVRSGHCGVRTAASAAWDEPATPNASAGERWDVVRCGHFFPDTLGMTGTPRDVVRCGYAGFLADPDMTVDCDGVCCTGVVWTSCCCREGAGARIGNGDNVNCRLGGKMDVLIGVSGCVDGGRGHTALRQLP